MRIAAIYDIHGNLPALEAVLAEVREAGVDRVLVGGDVVPGPLPGEALDFLRGLEIPVEAIRGNGEVAVLDHRAGQEPLSVPEHAREAVKWAAGKLEPAHAEWIATWPLTRSLEIPGIGTVLFCHATPRDETEIFTRETPEERLLPVFEGVEAAVVACGHTHMQFDRRVGSLRVVNAGSVGMPFGDPGAFWLLLGSDLDSPVQLRRTAYDLEGAAAQIRETGYPMASQVAEGLVQPTPEEEILKIFSKAELR